MVKQECNAHFVNALDTLKPNKKFAKREKLRQKRIEKDAKDEWPPLRRENEKARKAAKKDDAKSVKVLGKKALKSSEKTAKKKAKNVPASPAPAKADKATKKLKSKLSQRRVINEIANAATGRESLRKAQARALVQKLKAEKAAEAKQKAKKERSAPAKKSKTVAVRETKSSDNEPSALNRTQGDAQKQNKARDGAEEAEAVPLLSRSEVERALLQRTISGEDSNSPDGAGGAAQGEVREDPTLYPPLALYDDYAEKKSGETLSEDQVLSQANSYFRDLRRRERQLNITAVRHIAMMKEINRRGGDKDGFRYILPRNTKELVRQMVLNAAQRSDEADVDPDTLVSNFLGDDVQNRTSDKPQRKHRKRSSTLSDFYQFQVSKRWTQNAERFLNRGRANRAMFEDKKRQRSIRKM